MDANPPTPPHPHHPTTSFKPRRGALDGPGCRIGYTLYVGPKHELAPYAAKMPGEKSVAERAAEARRDGTDPLLSAEAALGMIYPGGKVPGRDAARRLVKEGRRMANGQVERLRPAAHAGRGFAFRKSEVERFLRRLEEDAQTREIVGTRIARTVDERFGRGGVEGGLKARALRRTSAYPVRRDDFVGRQLDVLG